MAEYLDGGRIQAHSNETDTVSTQSSWKKIGSTKLDSATSEIVVDSLSTGDYESLMVLTNFTDTVSTSQSTDEDLNNESWSGLDSNITNSGTPLTVENIRDVNNTAYHDIGTANITDTWTLKFKLTVSGWSQSGNTHGWWQNLSLSSNNSHSGSSHDGMDFMVHNASNSEKFLFSPVNGGGVSFGSGGILRDSDDSAEYIANGDYYVTIERSSEANYTCTVRTVSHSGTVLGSVSGTNATGVADLRYIKVSTHKSTNASGGGGKLEFSEIDLTTNTTDGNTYIQFNDDGNQKYALRHNRNGTEGTSINQSTGLMLSGGSTDQAFSQMEVTNRNGSEKLVIGTTVLTGGSGAGTGTRPDRQEFVGKWTEKSGTITSVTITRGNASNFSAGDECVVLANDITDAGTGTNYWQELYKGDLSGGTASTITTGDIQKKKWLIVETYTELSSDANCGAFLSFNGDTTDSGGNYAYQYEHNSGWSDGSFERGFIPTAWSDGRKQQSIAYICNVADREKLVWYTSSSNGVGTGTGNACTKFSGIGKWVNTTDQINKILVKGIYNGGTLGTNSIMRIWGAD